MPSLLIGLLVLALVLWGAKSFTTAQPQYLVRLSRYGGGTAALAVAALLGARGLVGLALPLGFAGLTLLGWRPFGSWGFGARAKPTAGQVSRVRSAFVEMELDHDSGAMRGRILAGRHEGTALEALPVDTLAGFLPEIDEESRALLMAYLDRRDPHWRDGAHAGAAAGQGGFAAAGKMTEQEAAQILGVAPGADAEEIGRAHRTLMKKLHPDQGGSTYLAARVNEAKETLLRRRG